MGSHTQPTSDNLHRVTEGIYKNLGEAFNPRLKHLISSGRAYQKALQSVSACSKNYIDALFGLGHAAEQANGAAKDIGTALLQIAEVHREIQKQEEENIKAFHRDLLIPLETKQDSEFKNLTFEYKKYTNGHKLLVHSYDKATGNLKKVRRKNKTKGFGQDAKEMQCLRIADDCRTKVDSHRFRGLKKMMYEERKRYCFLLDRVCTTVRTSASHHNKANEMLTHRLQEWSNLYKDPTQLPETAEALLAISNEEKMFPSVSDHRNHNSITDLSQNNVDNLHRQTLSQDAFDLLPNGRPRSLSEQHIMENRTNGGTTLPRSITVPPPPAQQPHVRALYDHVTTQDNQLQFNMGDIIKLIGDKRDGWQYGENAKTHKMGWFPLSFTEAFDTNQKTLNQRAKSMIDLIDSPDDEQIQTTLPPGFHSYVPADPRSRTLPTTRPVSVHEVGPPGDTRSSTLQGRMDPSQAPPPPPTIGPPGVTTVGGSVQQSGVSPNTPTHSFPQTMSSQAFDSRSLYSSPLHVPASRDPYSNLPPPPAPFDNPAPHGGQGSHYAESNIVTTNNTMYPSMNSTQPFNQQGRLLNQSSVGVPSPFPPPPPPDADYDEENGNSSMFSNVKLRKAQTNDRSAPRIY